MVVGEASKHPSRETRQFVLGRTERTYGSYNQREFLVSDTVGFIRDMPSDLFSAFRATFEEAGDADLLLEVVDASDSEYPEHLYNWIPFTFNHY